MNNFFWAMMVVTFIVLLIVAETIKTPFLSLAVFAFGIAVFAGIWAHHINNIDKE
jgi:FtsH-binding integral membrane protein